MIQRRLWRVLAGALLGYSMLTHAAPARASSPESVAEGRAHFTRGVDFYKEGDFRNALVEFKRAYELAPNYKLLYNLGQTALELQDYAFALRSFERYLTEGGKEIPPNRRGQVNASLEKLKQRVAEVTVTTNVTDAEILVDDVSAGRSPLSTPLLVSAGRRKISVSKGSASATRTIEVVGGDRSELSLNIEGPAPKPPEGKTVSGSIPSEPTATAPSSDSKDEAARRPAESGTRAESGALLPVSNRSNSGGSLVWVGVITTGVLATATAVTGVLALDAHADFDRKLDRYPVGPHNVSDARDRTQTWALATDILGVATAVSGSVTLWAALTRHRHNEPTAAKVSIQLAPNGVRAGGRF